MVLYQAPRATAWSLLEARHELSASFGHYRAISPCLALVFSQTHQQLKEEVTSLQAFAGERDSVNQAIAKLEAENEQLKDQQELKVRITHTRFHRSTVKSTCIIVLRILAREFLHHCEFRQPNRNLLPSSRF